MAKWEPVAAIVLAVACILTDIIHKPHWSKNRAAYTEPTSHDRPVGVVLLHWPSWANGYIESASSLGPIRARVNERRRRSAGCAAFEGKYHISPDGSGISDLACFAFETLEQDPSCDSGLVCTVHNKRRCAPLETCSLGDFAPCTLSKHCHALPDAWGTTHFCPTPCPEGTVLAEPLPLCSTPGLPGHMPKCVEMCKEIPKRPAGAVFDIICPEVIASTGLPCIVVPPPNHICTSKRVGCGSPTETIQCHVRPCNTSFLKTNTALDTCPVGMHMHAAPEFICRNGQWEAPPCQSSVQPQQPTPITIPIWRAPPPPPPQCCANGTDGTRSVWNGKRCVCDLENAGFTLSPDNPCCFSKIQTMKFSSFRNTRLPRDADFIPCQQCSESGCTQTPGCFAFTQKHYIITRGGSTPGGYAMCKTSLYYNEPRSF